MFRSLYFFNILILLFCSCNYTPVNVDNGNVLGQAKRQIRLGDSGAKKPTPVWGYRFAITGDFNGDGKKDSLTEHYFSRVTGKETNQFYKADYDYDVEMANKTYSFIVCNDKSIRQLDIAPHCNLGLLYLKNEGDLNGDGGDEISCVTNKADWSNLNVCTIMTYKNGKWIMLYWFPIWEWQLPELPRFGSQNGLLDINQGKITNADTANQRLLNELKKFNGLVKKAGKNKI